MDVELPAASRPRELARSTSHLRSEASEGEARPSEAQLS